jgi:hypothetical protein
MAQRRSRGIALPILSLGARWGLVVNATSRSPLFTGAGTEWIKQIVACFGFDLILKLFHRLDLQLIIDY